MADEVPATERMWRSLIRFERVHGKMAVLVLPGWEATVELAMPVAHLPIPLQEILAGVEFPYRCHARVNIGANKAEDIKFSDWEF